VIIRHERAADAGQVRAILTAAFETAVEADLVERLRHDADMALALVYERDGEVVGYAGFPRLTVNGTRAVGLAPLAVMPAMQRKGVGGALIREGLRQLAACGMRLVFVLGDPNYYGRFGFSAERAGGFESPYAGAYFMALALADDAPHAGEVRYPAGFDGLG
jgi:putative acetyltransferase